MEVSDIFSFGPVFLVPTAWIMTLGSIEGMIGTRPVMISHLVMLIFMTGFLLFGWDRMKEGILVEWRYVIVFGLLFTGLATLGFIGYVPARSSFVTEIIYWSAVPGLVSIHTGVKAGRDLLLTGGGLLSLIGSEILLAWVFGLFSAWSLGIISIWLGQSAALVKAVKMDKGI